MPMTQGKEVGMEFEGERKLKSLSTWDSSEKKSRKLSMIICLKKGAHIDKPTIKSWEISYPCSLFKSI